MPVLLWIALACVPVQDKAVETTPEQEASRQLAKVRRIYIDILTGGDSALQIRDLLMTSLQTSKQFVLTEDEEKADAVLRGAAKDEVFVENFSDSESLNAHTQMGGGINGNSRTSRYMGLSIGENESRHTQERKHEAMATVRLVSRDGDVIWSTTAESLGGKFLGASADVADKIAKRLVLDYTFAKKQAASGKGKPENGMRMNGDERK